MEESIVGGVSRKRKPLQNCFRMLPQNSPKLPGSLEVQRAYHLEKIKLLEIALTRLNILEHPREISDICSDIIDTKKNLEMLSSDKNRK